MTNQTDRENLLPARSIIERHFYLMVTQCEHCELGPFDLVSSERTGDDRIDIWYVRCRSCRTGRRLMFDRSKLLVEERESTESALPVVNPTERASELLDVGQWLALFHAIISAAAEQTDRKEAQRLGYEATLCLEEALKFYSPDSELPGEEAFFTESSRRRLQEHPEQFAREKLHQMRQKLPSLRAMRAQLDDRSAVKGGSDQDKGKRGSRWSWLTNLFRRRSKGS